MDIDIMTVLFIILLLYSAGISIMYFTGSDQTDIQKQRDAILNAKEEDLKNRESIIVDKELCFREITKLKTIQNSALDILKSYNLPTPNSEALLQN